MRLVWALILVSILVAQDGAAVYQKHCDSCHRAGNDTRAPLLAALRLLPKPKILATLETGSMKAQGAALSAAERAAVAGYLAVAPGTEGQTAKGMCAGTPPPIQNPAGWNGWGADLINSRFQPAAAARLDGKRVGQLKLKWAFGLAGMSSALAQPIEASGRLYFGSANGTVYSLDAKSGCTWWTFKAAAMVRTSITIAAHGAGRYALYFGDAKSNVYAIDAGGGAEIWKTQVETHAYSRITGAPVLYQGRLFVPVSSIEEVAAQNPKYVCCTFRGSVAALDARDGKQIWKTHTIPDPPQPAGKNSAGTERVGPSGAAIWSAPTVDVKRRVLYVGTGNGYSNPEDSHSDAIMAYDLETGSVKWSAQMTPRDNWNMACINPNRASCPESPGEDLDFGSSPILKRVGGRDLLIAGQKSGIVHALDPDKQGAIVWQTRIGRGGALGGIEWGSAVDDEKVYVALSDIVSRQPEAGGGLFALRLADGSKVWHTPAPKPACAGKPGCTAAQMAAVTAIPGVVFSGSMDGHLRAYDTADGRVIWDFDTLREFETVNGVAARGGSLNAGGPVVAGGMLWVNSGYGALAGMPGNVLLAFE
ncbi:MAG: PQQ-binding-like beta-propeller repeat protein [Bryobacteraceae bacterium]